jgi:hypothetical protein
VPYDLTATNGAELENLLHQEVPRIVLNSLREHINTLDVSDAARALFDASAPHLQFENWIESAIREVFTTFRSSTAAVNNSAAPPTPQSLLGNQYITEVRRAAHPIGLQPTHLGLLQSAHHSGNVESSPATAPSVSTETMQRSNNIVQPNTPGGRS